MKYSFPHKILLMDAGLIEITSEEPFGNIIGKVKEFLSCQGDLIEISEVQGKFNKKVINEKKLPTAIRDYDFILDYSSIFRHRVLAVKVEAAEDNKYYLILRLGDKNRMFKSLLLFVAIILSFIASYLYFPLYFCFSFLFLALYFLPSRSYKTKLANIKKQCKSIS